MKSAVRSVKKVFTWRCIAPGSRAGHVLGQQRNSFEKNKARTGLAGARRMQSIHENNFIV